MKVLLEDFGCAPLIAEYDAEQRVIRVNARVVARMRLRHGQAAAQALIACAVAHERYHSIHAGATEEAAHAHAQAVTGWDPHRLEKMAW